jgi:hypothetical protein
MLVSPVGLRSEKGCAGDARQKLETTDPTSHQRGRPTSSNPQLSKSNQREKGKNWLRVSDGCLTPGRTGRLAVGRNITLTLTFRARGYNWATMFVGDINTGTWPSRFWESQMRQ